MRELVSVIMSAYNEKLEYVEKAIDSMLNQTWEALEIVIVIDNPENMELIELIEKYERNNKNIIVIHNEKNIGLPSSLNKALEIVNGQYVARMDADDISFPERIEKQIAFLKTNELDMVASKKIDIDENDNIIRRNGKVVKSKRINKVLPYANFIVHSSVLMNIHTIKELSGYRDFKAAQDYDLWLRMITQGYSIGIIEEELIYYRIRQDSIGIKNAFFQRIMAEYIQSLYRERKKNKSFTDSHSSEMQKKFLELMKYDNEKEKSKYNKAFLDMKLGLKKIYEHQGGYALLLKSLRNRHIRKHLCGVVIAKIYKFV